MAGRKPRVTRDEQAGVTPLKGRRPRGNGEGKGPARGYSRPPFEPGNTAAVTHGAHSRQAEQRAAEILAGLLEDAQMPDHVRSPAFRYHAVAWAKAEAVAEALFAYVAGMDGEAMTTPRLAATRSPVDIWRGADAHAGRLRARLGLDPLAYAALAKDLGLAFRAQDEALERLGAQGAEIAARRAAELEAGHQSAPGPG